MAKDLLISRGGAQPQGEAEGAAVMAACDGRSCGAGRYSPECSPTRSPFTTPAAGLKR
jgi:hypothetical protein